MFEERPVLFFDSGLGGLSVLREARLAMPRRRFLYIMDNGGFPYGAWKEDALRARIMALFADLLTQYNPILCVLACNTASTLALEDLRRAFPQFAFVGTVPAIKLAAERSASKLISVLATPGTVKRAYTRDLIIKYAGNSSIKLVGSKNLASLAEDYLRSRPISRHKIQAEIAPCFVEHDGRRTDIIVLACTHYPFLVPVFRSLAPWPVDWLDPAEAIARRARQLLAQQEAAAACQERPAQACADKGGRQSKALADDYAVFTEGGAAADFATERLLHAFGLKIKKNR